MKGIFTILLLFITHLHASPSLIEQGNQFLQQQKLDEAHHCFSQALTQTIQDSEQYAIGNALLNLGNMYYQQAAMEKSATIFQQLVDLFPHSSAVHHNLGLTLVELTRYDKAEKVLAHACMLKPDNPDFHVALATTQLALGNYEQGWENYEQRWQQPDKKALTFSAIRWDGIQSLRGKTILLLSEGALGDCIQFVRYAQCIKELGATVILKTLKPLTSLLSNCSYIDKIITEKEPLPATDYYTSLMSLPALMHTTIDTVPIPIPYINAEPTLIELWKNKFIDANNINIGICWQADTTNDANRPPQAQRSIPADMLAPLALLPNIKLYSLQQGAVAPPCMHDFGPTVDTANGRFMDTAAIMCNLDLVISVDTAIAHLAGALGTPTWLILPYKADWRWLTTQRTTPWYPTMHIFRKNQSEPWTTVIEKIIDKVSFFIIKKETAHEKIL